MSKHVAVAVFDNAAQCFHPPQFFRATGAAMRWFEDLVKNPEAKEIHSHREHFQLFQVGEFDDFDGVLTPSGDRPQLLVNGSAFDG